MALSVFTLFPKQKWLGYVAVTYALYIGIGVSMTIHWFSDFVAGALIGAIIGVVVGTGFSRSQV
jgi:membrane-associated phospholipid phosphatase